MYVFLDACIRACMYACGISIPTAIPDFFCLGILGLPTDLNSTTNALHETQLQVMSTLIAATTVIEATTAGCHYTLHNHPSLPSDLVSWSPGAWTLCSATLR